MEPNEIYLSLSRRFRRGEVVFGSLWIASMVTIVVAVEVKNWSLVAAGFLAGMQFGLANFFIHRSNEAAWNAAFHPQMVYWVRPTAPSIYRRGSRWVRYKILEENIVTLHLRDGRQFEIHKPAREINLFLAWLQERNPTVRIGSYD
jgi:hypothetical protein